MDRILGMTMFFMLMGFRLGAACLAEGGLHDAGDGDRQAGGAGVRPLAPATIRRIHGILRRSLAQGVKFDIDG